LLRDLRMPIVTTLHTVLRDPSSEQHRVLSQIGDLSARLVVMSERARGFLHDVYDVPEAKIDLIAHGIPDMPFVDPNFYKDQFGVEGKFVALTFGLLPTSFTSCWGRLTPTWCANRANDTASAWNGSPKTSASKTTSASTIDSSRSMS
jgi:hypothetical protein